jgi:hypothetical protein
MWTLGGVRRSALLLATLAAVAGLAGADDGDQNDAGSGHDAGGSWATALALPGFGSYTGFLSSHDVDAFVVNQASTSAACVSFTYAPATADLVTVQAVNGGSTTSSSFQVPAGGTLTGGIATTAYSSVGLLAQHAGSTTGPDGYAFSLARPAPGSGLVTSTAGHSMTTASPIAPCDAASLAPLTSVGGDYYSLGNLPAGSAISTSLATSAGTLFVQILDSNGNVLAQAPAGQTASTTTATSGTYYVQVFRTDFALVSVPYILGSTVDPGPACQPMC